MIRVATLEELQEKGVMVVRGTECPIAVFAHEGKVSAVDNRCPHLGFPLHRGSVQDGILTCHWHHARFDLCSGCTFDMFADDAPAFETEVRDGAVFVDPAPRRGVPHEYYLRRLRQGMEQSIGLIQAKSLLGLLRAGVPHRDIVREIALFGVRNRGTWATGLTLITAVANILEHLDEETAYLALYQATRQIAADCASQPVRRELRPLETESLPLETLKRWLHYWTRVRHREGAERTLLTAIHNGATPRELIDLLASAATDRPYADGGHTLDFCNKAFELLDYIGWEHAAEVLPTLIPGIVNSRGGEEMNSWRYPVDLVELMREVENDLPNLLGQGTGKQWDEVAALGQALLVDDPKEILCTLRKALMAGARPAQVSQAVTYAAALRLARFGTANELGDWLTALHTFTYCNAIHEIVRRDAENAPLSTEPLRGVLHGAMSVYLDRFLNVPPAPLPGERGNSLDHEPADTEELLARFLEVLDQRHEVEAAARSVARYVSLDGAPSALFNVQTRATMREDLDFHATQMLEGGIRQYGQWEGAPAGNHILIAGARYLAAHCPTQRARLQTAEIALRLHRGDNLYEDEADADTSV